MLLTRDLIAAIAPRPKKYALAKVWDGYVDALTSAAAVALFSKFGITTKLRMAHLLAQWAHETGGFTIIWESGAYSADRIMQIFGVGRHSAAITASEARGLAQNGPALFDRVYGVGNPRKCRELGNDRPGDGWNYRGCGIVQITGKGAHFKYAAKIGVPPAKLAEPLNSVHAALLEWEEKGCTRWADADDYVKVRRLINGGRNGLADVRAYLAVAKRALKAYEAPDVKDDLPDGTENDLRLGSEGPDVVWLQTRLAVHGYFAGEIDGKFGKYVEAALLAFQKQQGLHSTTGIYDPDDKDQREALESEPRPKDIPTREVTKEDLRERGSETLRLLAWIKTRIAVVLAFLGIGAVDQQSGTQVLDTVLTKGEELKQTADRTSDLMSYAPSWQIIVIVCAALGLVALYRKLTQVEDRRVEDAVVGANLGK